MDLKGTLLTVTTAFLIAGSTTLSAREWTEAKSGRTLQGDYVEVEDGKAVIKSGSRTLKIEITRLSEADQKFIQEKIQAAAEKAARASVEELAPPATLKISPITGTGEERKSTIIFKNTSEKEISRLVVGLLFLTSDGTLQKNVPHTHSSASAIENNHTINVTSFFMDDETTALDAIVTGILYTDGSMWPFPPSEPPAQVGDEPLAAKMIGTVGQGDRAIPVAAFHHYGEKPITALSYRYKFLDKNGEVLDTALHGYSGSDPIVKGGQSATLTGGGSPPEGTVDAQIQVERITYEDNSSWKLPK